MKHKLVKRKRKRLQKRKGKKIDNCFLPESTDWIIVNDTKSKCLDAIDKNCINVKACKKCGSDNWTQWIRGEECTSHRDRILRLKMNCLVRQNGTCDPDVDERSTTADGITTGGLRGDEIAGITVGIAILIALVAIFVCLVKNRRRKRRSRPNIESSSIDGADNIGNTVLAIVPPVESSAMYYSAQQTRKDSHKYQGINGQANSPLSNTENEYLEIVPNDEIGGQFRILPSVPSGNSGNRNSITISRPDVIPDNAHPRSQDDLESNTYNALWQDPGTNTSTWFDYYGSLKGEISTGVLSNDADGYCALEDVPHNEQVEGKTPHVGAQNQAADGGNTYNTLWQDPLNHATGMTPDHYGKLNNKNSATAPSNEADGYLVPENVSDSEHVAQTSTVGAQARDEKDGNTYNTLWQNSLSHATGTTPDYYATLDVGNSAATPSDETDG